MRGNRALVGWFIVATFVVWIAFDVWLGANGGPTESMVLADWGKRYTIFPWLIGFLSGHWFFGKRNPWFSAWGFGIGFMVGLVGWDVWWWQFRGIIEPVYPWFRYPGLWFLLGIPSGMYLWGQRNVDSPIP